jgi:hypothetical protein
MVASRRGIDPPVQSAFRGLCIPLLLTGGLCLSKCSGSEPALALLLAQTVAATQPRLVYLQPGTRISDKPPKGWTHLVLKSLPRLASGDRASLPAGVSKMATFFRTAIVADIQPSDPDTKDFVLAQVGVGICVPQDEVHDVVVSSDRLDALGLHLSTVERLVLDAAEAELAEGRIIARTPTFALFRTPASLVVAGKHRKIALYYAFCVEGSTGQLCSAVWAMRPESEPQLPPSALVKLSAHAIYDCELDVKAKRILGAIPLSWSFAMRTLPPGVSVSVPADLGELIVATARRPGDADAKELERSLAKVLRGDPDPIKAKPAKRNNLPSSGVGRQNETRGLQP